MHAHFSAETGPFVLCVFSLTAIVMAKGGRPVAVILMLIDTHTSLDSWKRFGGLIAEDAHAAPTSEPFTIQFSTMCVCRVLQDDEPFLVGPGTDRLHLTRVSEPVDWNQGAGLCGQSPLGIVKIEVQRPRIHVDEDRD